MSRGQHRLIRRDNMNAALGQLHWNLQRGLSGHCQGLPNLAHTAKLPMEYFFWDHDLEAEVRSQRGV